MAFRQTLFLVTLALGWTGCGAPGDPLPPLANIPSRTNDLEAVLRAGELILQWTLPSTTTEDSPLKDLERVAVLAVEVGNGTAGDEAFDAGAREVVVLQQPPVGERVERRVPPPAPPGRRIALTVQNYGRRGRTAGNSNIVVIEIASAPAAPSTLRAAGQADSVRLEWPPVAGATGYQVYRGRGQQPDFALLGAVEEPNFSDVEFEWNTSHRYLVRAYVKTSTGIVEGADSPVEAIVPQDTFPPAPPGGLRAVAGETAVDLSWDLSSEPDAAGYNIYRRAASDASAPAAKLNPELLAAPVFSDQQIQRGQQYSYSVTAVDNKGNESTPSEPVAVNLP